MFQLDDTLKLLSNEYRRNIMYVFSRTDQEIYTYDEIAEKLVEQEHLDEIVEERFKIQMTHNHIPKIEQTGIIDHDRRSETVRYLGDNDIENLLSDLRKYE